MFYRFFKINYIFHAFPIRFTIHNNYSIFIHILKKLPSSKLIFINNVIIRLIRSEVKS